MNMWTWIALLVGCGSSSAPSMQAESVGLRSADDGDGMAAGYGGMADEMAMEEAEGEPSPAPPARSRPMAKATSAPMDLALVDSSEVERGSAKGKDKNAAGGDDGPAVREWFPESFLWQPIVETSAAGTAELDVLVPDQLTSWRVLALAHSRDGQQAGAVHSFDSRLPLYVDPVIPGWLYSGDRIELPVQIVNTTKNSISSSLSVEAFGALSGSGGGSVKLAAGGSAVERVSLAATGAGASKITALLEDADAVERVVRVLPEGRPVSRSRGGTLSGPRSFALAGPDGADGSTQELRVLVFPGPLAVLQSEIERAGTGAAHPYDPAYSFALASRLTALSAKTGNDVDESTLRDLKLLGWQRVVREARSPTAGRAADLAASMREVEGHELAEELRDRLVKTVVAGQRSDGTWARQDRGSLQIVLVQTAFAARTLPEDETGARLRAAGVLERRLKDVDDAYTAAVWLASGVAGGTEADALRKVVLDAISEDDTGAHSVSIPSVVNPWGVRPSKAEMLAWTSLALADQHDLDWRGDLVAELMSGYDAAWGFGAGAADVIALEAVATALPGLERPTTVTLKLDGEVVGEALLDPAQPKLPALLTARPGAKNPKIEISTDQAAGLAFVATLDSWVPWTGDEALAGVEVEVDATKLRVGETGVITLRLSAPSGSSVTLEQGLPAGVALDEAATRSRSPGLTELTASQDRVRLVTRPFGAGELIEVQLVVTPAFAGSFATRPLKLAAGGAEVFVPPLRWAVSRS